MVRQMGGGGWQQSELETSTWLSNLFLFSIILSHGSLTAFTFCLFLAFTFSHISFLLLTPPLITLCVIAYICCSLSCRNSFTFCGIFATTCLLVPSWMYRVWSKERERGSVWALIHPTPSSSSTQRFPGISTEIILSHRSEEKQERRA